MDKSFWKAIIAADYAIPADRTTADLTPELLEFLGAPDPELRDDIAYSILAQWIIRGVYTPDDQRALIPQMTHNLSNGLGERNTNSVFLRSFSTLVLAAIVYRDNHQPFLTEPEVRGVMDQTLHYFAEEQDLRGYVPDKGWAHSCAHTADLIDELALHRFLGASDLERLLWAVADKVLAPSGTILLYDEDERLSVAVVSALRRDLLSRSFFESWLGKLAGFMERTPRHTIFSDANNHSAYLNTKNLLRSAYLRLSRAEDIPDSVRDIIPLVLATYGKFTF